MAVCWILQLDGSHTNRTSVKCVASHPMDVHDMWHKARCHDVKFSAVLHSIKWDMNSKETLFWVRPKPSLTLYAAKTEGKPLRQHGGNCGAVAKQESGSLQPHHRKSTSVRLIVYIVLYTVYCCSAKLILMDWGNLSTKKIALLLINVRRWIKFSEECCPHVAKIRNSILLICSIHLLNRNI